MRAILEKIGNDKYLEFALSDREVKSLLSRRLVTCDIKINGKLYHVGVRTLTSREKVEEEDAISQRKESGDDREEHI